MLSQVVDSSKATRHGYLVYYKRTKSRSDGLCLVQGVPQNSIF